MASLQLPFSVEALRELVLEQQSTIEEQAERLAFLEEWNRLLRSQRFGSKSEKIPPEQGRLFNEAERDAGEAGEAGPIEAEIEVPAHTRRSRGRRPLPGFLPVEEQLHDLAEAEKICAHDSMHRLVEIGRETTDQLKFIPAPSPSCATSARSTPAPFAKERCESRRCRSCRFRRAWRRRRCSPTWPRRSTSMRCRSTGRRRSSRAWASISRGARWLPGW
jgi:hypothetical protein